MRRLFVFFAVFGFTLCGAFKANAENMAPDGPQGNQSEMELVELVAKDLFNESRDHLSAPSYEALSDSEKEIFRALARSRLISGAPEAVLPLLDIGHSGVEI